MLPVSIYYTTPSISRPKTINPPANIRPFITWPDDPRHQERTASEYRTARDASSGHGDPRHRMHVKTLALPFQPPHHQGVNGHQITRALPLTSFAAHARKKSLRAPQTGLCDLARNDAAPKRGVPRATLVRTHSPRALSRAPWKRKRKRRGTAAPAAAPSPWLMAACSRLQCPGVKEYVLCICKRLIVELACGVYI